MFSERKVNSLDKLDKKMYYTNPEWLKASTCPIAYIYYSNGEGLWKYNNTKLVGSNIRVYKLVLIDPVKLQVNLAWSLNELKEKILKQLKNKEEKMNRLKLNIGDYYMVKNTWDQYVRVPVDVELNQGDKIVISECGNNYIILTVDKIFPKLDFSDETLVNVYNTTNYAYYVDKVDTSRFEGWIANAKRRELILKELERKKEEMEELAIFKLLAEQDKEAAKLLEELKEL